MKIIHRKKSYKFELYLNSSEKEDLLKIIEFCIDLYNNNPSSSLFKIKELLIDSNSVMIIPEEYMRIFLKVIGNSNYLNILDNDFNDSQIVLNFYGTVKNMIDN